MVVKTKQQQQTVAMNEALVLGSVHQHQLTEESEKLNEQLRREIAERARVEQSLTEKARLLDLSNDAIVVLDHEHRIRYWNHGAEKLYGWSSEEVVGKISYVLLHTKSTRPMEQISEELERNHHWTGELTHSKRDGQPITVLVRRVLDRDSQGKAVAILESMTDITQRTKAVEALRAARTRLADHAGQLEGVVTKRTAELTASNQRLEAIVYSMAHDLRAPLRSMQGFAALLVDEASTALSESGRDYVHRIDQSAQFMDALLSDLMAYTRNSQQRVELTTVSLEKVVGSVLSRMQKEIANVNACMECSGPWPDVRAHEPTLTQVLSNLTGNALKFVRPGGDTAGAYPGGGASRVDPGLGGGQRTGHLARQSATNLPAFYPPRPREISRHRRWPGPCAERHRTHGRPGGGGIDARAGQPVLDRAAEGLAPRGRWFPC